MRSFCHAYSLEQRRKFYGFKHNYLHTIAAALAPQGTRKILRGLNKYTAYAWFLPRLFLRYAQKQKEKYI